MADFDDDPVMVCNGCGKGFLVPPRGLLDPDPKWAVGFTDAKPITGPFCGGSIILMSRRRAIAKVRIS